MPNDKHDSHELSHDLANAVSRLTHVLSESLEWSKSHNRFATKHDLDEMEKRIMSQISDYTDRVGSAFDAISASVDGIVTSVAGVAGDVAALKAIIEKLQNTPGVLSPEDQALLDALEAKVTSLVDKTAATATAIAALDEQTNEPAPQP